VINAAAEVFTKQTKHRVGVVYWKKGRRQLKFPAESSEVLLFQIL
jgi:hypothetical protein